MEMEAGSGSVAITLKRAEIDTTAPFRSVKEAVTMFGDTPLSGQPFASKVKQAQMDVNGQTSQKGNINDDLPNSKPEVEAELEETKHSLQKAIEESLVMENRLCSLRQELERTKRELRGLKQKAAVQPRKQHLNSEDDDEDQLDEIESVEIVEDSAKLERTSMQITSTDDDDEEKEEVGEEEEGRINENIKDKFHNKRYVRFRNPAATLAQEKSVPHGALDKLERHPSLRRKKKKGLIPLIGSFFSKRRPAHEVA